MEGPLIIEAGRILREKGEETKLHMTVQPTYLGWRDFVSFFFPIYSSKGLNPGSKLVVYKELRFGLMKILFMFVYLINEPSSAK